MINRFYINKLDPKGDLFRIISIDVSLSYFYLICWPSSKAFAVNPRVPSQALPKMFRGQAGPDYYDIKKQEEVLPDILPKKTLNQQEDTGVRIIPETLIILAPKELQNIIDIDKL